MTKQYLLRGGYRCRQQQGALTTVDGRVIGISGADAHGVAAASRAGPSWMPRTCSGTTSEPSAPS